MNDHIHSESTRRNGYRYLFLAKHHGAGSLDDAQWSDAVSPGEEFSVFDSADYSQIDDERGWLHGVLRDDEGELRDLGTWRQEVAVFPKASAGSPWHGYPLWPLGEGAPANRTGEKARPSRSVFQKMEEAGMINAQQHKRLLKAKHA